MQNAKEDRFEQIMEDRQGVLTDLSLESENSAS